MPALRAPALALLFSVFLVPSLAAQSVEERNKATARAMIEAINDRDLDRLDDLVAADMVRHSQSTPGVEVTSLDDFKAFLESDFAAVPDSEQRCPIMLAEGDYVAAWCRYEGTQHGRMGPYPPTGKPLSLEFAGLLRLEGGSIAEMWVVWDNLAALIQLGHLDVVGGQKR